MWPEIKLELNRMIAKFQCNNNISGCIYKEMKADELRGYANHLLSIADKLDKLNAALEAK